MSDLQTAIDAFLAHLNAMRAKANEGRTTPYFLTASVEPGKSYARVVVDNGGQRSAYAFIALVDNTTKGMGVVKAGEVFKPDGWKAPAKIARADVFKPETWKAAGLYSMEYRYR